MKDVTGTRLPKAATDGELYGEIEADPVFIVSYFQSSACKTIS